MSKSGFWIETVALGTAIACALALLIATLAAATAAVTGNSEFGQTPTPAPVQSHTFEGMVTCSRCWAKHSPAHKLTASDCVRQCVHDGVAFALVDGDRSYVLDGDLISLKRVAGQRARVVGDIRGNTITVSSVSD